MKKLLLLSTIFFALNSSAALVADAAVVENLQAEAVTKSAPVKDSVYVAAAVLYIVGCLTVAYCATLTNSDGSPVLDDVIIMPPFPL